MPYTYRQEGPRGSNGPIESRTEKVMRISHAALTALVVGAAIGFFQVPPADAG
jgi:hypothetical protein